MRYVIAGNGILALSTAFRLTQRIGQDDSIVIIGPRTRLGAATPAAAAMLNSYAEISAYSLKSEPDRYHFELSREAGRKWAAFEEEMRKASSSKAPLSRGEKDRGTYMLNNTASDEWDDRNFDAVAKALTDFKEPFDWVNPADIPNYLPSQHLRATRALYIRGEGWLNPRLILQTLDEILSGDTRVTMTDASAKRFVKNGSLVTAVELEDGSMVEGDVFLLANGATASSLLKRSELGIAMQPVFYGVGISLEIKSTGHPHQKCVRTTNRGGACGVYTAPLYLGEGQPDDHIVVGASNRVVNDPTQYGRLQSIEHLRGSAIREINGHFYAAELIRVNVGWRPTSQDTYPLIGKTSVANFHVATGTKRDGFHLSPVISDYMATLMIGGTVDERFVMFSPERAVIHDIPREEGIEMIVNSLMSEQYQHGYLPSNVRMNAQVRDTYRKDIEALHDKVGAKDWAMHPELVNMYRQGHTI